MSETGSIFITLEGPDGAGKSSQQTRLAEQIRMLGREVVATREPGGTDLGERVRSILLETNEADDPLADALLFNAARRRLVEGVIKPALARGAVVLCDRFVDSTIAYQGYGGGAPIDVLEAIGSIATGGLVPTRTVLLDVDVDAALARRHGGPEHELTRFETSQRHDRTFHERVRAGYLEMANREPARWRVVEASGSPDNVAVHVWESVRDLFGP